MLSEASDIYLEVGSPKEVPSSSIAPPFVDAQKTVPTADTAKVAWDRPDWTV